MALYLTNSNYISQIITTLALNTSSIATLTDVNVVGNLQMNGTSGSSTNVIIKSGPTTQGWTNLPANTIVPGTNGQFAISNAGLTQWTSGTTYFLAATITEFTVANLNAAATNLITFGAGSGGAFTSNKFGTTNFTGLNWVELVPPYQTIICQNDGFYRFRFTIALVNASVGTTQVRLIIRINGVTDSASIYSTILPLATSGNNIISGAIYRKISAGDTLQFFSIRVNGTGALNILVSACNITVTCVDGVSST